MKVLFFAQAREAAGRADCILETKQPMTQAELWSVLVRAFPALAPHQKTSRLARDEEYLHADDLLKPNDEIAIIPPVSGG